MNVIIDMRKLTSIALSEHFDGFVQRKVAEGKYQNVDEVINAGLQLLEQEEKKNQALRKAIQDGIDSQVVASFGPTMHLRELKKLKSLNE